MTREEIMVLNLEQVEERSNALSDLLKSEEGVNLEEAQTEAGLLAERRTQLIKEIGRAHV